MGFPRQEYWSGLPFPPPVDHTLSELFTTTCLPWVALHGESHSFTKLHKPLRYDKAVIHEEKGCPNLCTLWSFSRIEVFQWCQSQFSGLSWVSSFISARMYKISLFPLILWIWALFYFCEPSSAHDTGVTVTSSHWWSVCETYLFWKVFTLSPFRFQLERMPQSVPELRVSKVCHQGHKVDGRLCHLLLKTCSVSLLFHALSSISYSYIFILSIVGYILSILLPFCTLLTSFRKVWLRSLHLKCLYPLLLYCRKTPRWMHFCF